MKKLFSVKKINKRIAKYLDLDLEWTENGFEEYSLESQVYSYFKYTDSLDALTLPVEKLMLEFIAAVGYSKINMTDKKRIEYKPYIEWVGREAELVDGFYETPAEALSMAVYTALEKK